MKIILVITFLWVQVSYLLLIVIISFNLLLCYIYLLTLFLCSDNRELKYRENRHRESFYIEIIMVIFCISPKR